MSRPEQKALFGQKKVCVVSLGCPKNTVDTEVMLGHLSQEGYSLTPDPDDADFFLVNTCGFIAPAKQESIDTILELAALKGGERERYLVVAGCLTERYHDALLKEIPEIDAVIGLGELAQAPAVFQSLEAGRRGAKDWRHDDLYPIALEPRLLVTPRPYAYLKISEGCDRTCTFCAIPKFRGKFRSRSIPSLVEEARLLVERGVKEIVLVSQNTTDFGYEAEGIRRLPNLLYALGEVENIGWLRTMYLYPDFLTDEVLEAYATVPAVVPYIDLPLQHADSKMLKAMGRKQDVSFLRELLARVRERVPGVTLRTTFIVGFPGETKTEFDSLCAFVEEQRFDHVGVFTYSPEDGTPAERLGNPVSDREKATRQRHLMALQQRIVKEKAAKRVGKTEIVLVDGLSDESDMLLQGRLASQAPEIDGVVLINDGEARQGDFARVTLTESHIYDWVGRIVVCSEQQ